MKGRLGMRVSAAHNSPKPGIATSALASVALACALFLCAAPARAQFQDPTQNIGVRPELLKEVGIDQKLGSQVPLGLSFHDEKGNVVQLNRYFGHGKPVVLSLVYFTCPMLCTQVENGLLNSLKLQSLDVGKDFEVLTVSIDPSDKPGMAKVKSELYTGIYGRPGAADGWHFLTGDQPQIKQLADSVGFRYAYDPDSKQYAHASAIMVLTPDGRVSRYLYGIEYPSRDMRLALIDASGDKISGPEDALLLFCYHYDPHAGRYGVAISRLLKAGGALTILLIALGVFFLARSEHYALPDGK
jgi:protein SCO1/2